MTLHSLLFVTISVIVLAVGFVQAEVLASSGMPMKGANPQRNYNINKKTLCPEVAPGRSQVWNVEWQTRPSPQWSSFFYDVDDVITQDSQGNIYLKGVDNIVTKIAKINGTTGATLQTYTPPSDRLAVLTHVAGNKAYMASDSYTLILDTATMTEIAVLEHVPLSSEGGSYAPYGTDLMVSSNIGESDIPLLRYLQTSTRVFNDTLPNLSAVFARDVLVHNGNLPIVVHSREELWLGIYARDYDVLLEGLYYLDQPPYLQDDHVIIHVGYVAGYGADYVMLTLAYNALTGELASNVSTRGWDDVLADEFGSFRVFGDKSIGFMKFYGLGMRIVDFLNEKLILEGRDIYGYPQYSVPDNSVLFISKPEGYNTVPELISLDWDTQTINAIGSFPTDGFYSDYVMSPPLIGDDCTVYSYYTDGVNYNALFAFKPLPISNVVPILECVNEHGVGQFSYRSLEDKTIIIPHTSDRNNLSPMELAPVTTFKANQRSLYYPFTASVTLANTTELFTWQLEDYVLSFTNTPPLRCPQNITIVMYFNATTAPNAAEFSEWVRTTIAGYIQLSESRVSVRAPNKRNLLANEFEIILQLSYDASLGSAEPNARLLIGRTLDFNSYIESDSPFAGNGIMWLSVNGIQLDTEISGTIPPKAAPVSAPTDQSPSAAPSQGTTPNNSPKSATSTAAMSLVSVSTAAVVAALLMM